MGEGRFFVNLPLGYVARDRGYLDFFAGQRLRPELGLDAGSLDGLDRRWHQDLARELRQEGLACAVHLPFIDLQPGSQDRLLLAATRERLKRAVDTAALYEPAHMVGHAAFAPAYAEEPDAWAERSLDTWSGMLGPWAGHPPLFLENTHETDPEPLRDLLKTLAPLGVGLCFDAGHWHSFSRGCVRGDLDRWLTLLAPYLRHLHLHDNDGSHDQHLGLGRGFIPWSALSRGLQALGLTPTVTLEPHTREDLTQSLAFLKAHPGFPLA